MLLSLLTISAIRQRYVQFAGVCLGLVVASFGLSAGAADAPDSKQQLYSVSVDVASRSLVDRKTAAATGLNTLLTRLSGLTVLPNSKALSAARSKPERFYSQFRYVTTNRYDDLGQTVTELSLKYSPPAVRRLMTAAELPLWTLNRPRVAIWLAERSGGGTDLIDDPDHPLLGALLGRARFRGLPSVVPGFSGISPNMVWDQNRSALERASNRLDADLLLVGRAEQLGPDDWQVRWTSWSEGQRRTLNLTGSLQSVSAPAMDMIADAQAQRFTVAGGKGSSLELIVENISALEDYAQVLKYLGSLGYIDKVDVSGLHSDELSLMINTTSSADNFSRLLQKDGRLLPSTRTARQRSLPATGQSAFELRSPGGVVVPREGPSVIPVPVVAESQLRMAWQG